ncbi:hypothetical protein JB92DRAFT_2837085 [Gautieria morchelliformis]|nr:hypothetical protein JB92DRAFT_2837085 [Gautieria morchelliformis]
MSRSAAGRWRALGTYKWPLVVEERVVDGECGGDAGWDEKHLAMVDILGGRIVTHGLPEAWHLARAATVSPQQRFHVRLHTCILWSVTSSSSSDPPATPTSWLCVSRRCPMAAFTLTRTHRRSPTSLIDPPVNSGVTVHGHLSTQAWTGGQPGPLHGGEGTIATALHGGGKNGEFYFSFSSSMSSPTQVPKPKRANRGKNMAALIEKEGLDEDGRPTKRPNLHRQQKRKRKQPKKTMQEEVEDEDDDEDRDFSDSSSGDVLSSESKSNEHVQNICEEVYDEFPGVEVERDAGHLARLDASGQV